MGEAFLLLLLYNNMQKLLTFLFLVFLVHTQAQTSVSENDVAAFIPKNYYIVKLAPGNLNLDNLTDVILVLGKNGEDSLSTLEHPIKRKCLILLGASNKTYTLAAQNPNVVYYYNYDPNFKDAFVDVRIEKGIFNVDHYGGFAQRWGQTTTFKYNPTDKIFYLIKDEYSTFDATEPDSTLSEKIYTPKNFGTVTFDKFNIYKTGK